MADTTASKGPPTAREPRARWILSLQARMWRFLMSIGMLLHKIAPPRPKKPDFARSIAATISGKAGSIPLQFYVPPDYESQKKIWAGRARAGINATDEEEGGDPKSNGKSRRVSTGLLNNVSQVMRRRSQTGRKWGHYPVVINFHGGGFTLGTATDDARWCETVVNECQAVVISVDYRKAPEYPFPTAVEDGVDAVLWVHKHAAELGVDKEKIALSGFSSGGNMCITVALRLWDEQNGFSRDTESRPSSRQTAERALHGVATTIDSDSSASTKVQPDNANIQILRPEDDPPSLSSSFADRHSRKASPNRRQAKEPSTKIIDRDIPNVKIRCIVPWYPSLDYTRTREQRRATNVRKDHELPAVFTNLFDDSYLHPPKTISLDSPYLSPGVAPTSLLKNALPQDIIMHTCEFDMLLDEGKDFRARITAPDIGKNVVYIMVEGVSHGWDKAPNPLKPTPGVKEHYLRACKEMRRVFGSQPGVREFATPKGISAAPRGSASVVN
ncbi:hypothetical protein LTR08_005480 [Meristemomyces frigidus]|nr:hypothetical protein LTR08_005480 [Meristemomyces frigidus]